MPAPTLTTLFVAERIVDPLGDPWILAAGGRITLANRLVAIAHAEFWAASEPTVERIAVQRSLDLRLLNSQRFPLGAVVQTYAGRSRQTNLRM